MLNASSAVVVRSLFVYQCRQPPTADALFDVFPANFSEPRSNAREKEATILLWSDFLQMVEGKIMPCMHMCDSIVNSDAIMDANRFIYLTGAHNLDNLL